MMTAMMMIKTEDSFSVLHLQYNCPSIRSAPFAAAILQLTCPLPFLHGCPSTARPRSSLRVLLIHMELRPERLYTQYAPFCSSSRFFLPFFFFFFFFFFLVVLFRTVLTWLPFRWSIQLFLTSTHSIQRVVSYSACSYLHFRPLLSVLSMTFHPKSLQGLIYGVNGAQHDLCLVHDIYLHIYDRFLQIMMNYLAILTDCPPSSKYIHS